MSLAIDLQPSLPDPHAIPSLERASNASVNTRGYSDSALPYCRAIMMKHPETIKDVISSSANLDGAGDRSEIAMIIQQRGRPRQNLRLPSFKTLGIPACPPDALLTPPDESTIDLKPAAPPVLISRSSSYPPSNMPDLADRSNTPIQSLSTTVPSVSTSSPTAATEPLDTTKQQEEVPPASSDEAADLTSIQGGWIAEAVQAAGKTDYPHT